jgi:excisionase family DNA binding protein
VVETAARFVREDLRRRLASAAQRNDLRHKLLTRVEPIAVVWWHYSPSYIPANDALQYIVANFAMTDEDVLTVEQVATELKLSAQTIRNWIKSGRLPAVQIGHVYRVKRQDVDTLATSHSGETGPLGAHRDLWAPETLGLPYRPREDTPRPSIWDGTSPPSLSSKDR